MPKKTIPARVDGRRPDQLRPIRIETGIAPASAGSCLIHMGRTRVICGVSIDNEVPRWMKAQKKAGGWVTAEYSMLPYCSRERARREVSSGKVGGRTSEIQRLIGRAMRAVVDLEALGDRTIWIDCDVLEADGGTRTASITGAWVALRLAVDKLLAEGALKKDPIRSGIAAISVGVVGGVPMLDLCYAEDSTADVDMNVVMLGNGEFVEVQGTAEHQTFSGAQLTKMLALAKSGCASLMKAQRAALA